MLPSHVEYRLTQKRNCKSLRYFDAHEYWISHIWSYIWLKCFSFMKYLSAKPETYEHVIVYRYIWIKLGFRLNSLSWLTIHYWCHLFNLLISFPTASRNNKTVKKVSPRYSYRRPSKEVSCTDPYLKDLQPYTSLHPSF